MARIDTQTTQRWQVLFDRLVNGSEQEQREALQEAQQIGVIQSYSNHDMQAYVVRWDKLSGLKVKGLNEACNIENTIEVASSSTEKIAASALGKLIQEYDALLPDISYLIDCEETHPLMGGRNCVAVYTGDEVTFQIEAPNICEQDRHKPRAFVTELRTNPLTGKIHMNIEASIDVYVVGPRQTDFFPSSEIRDEFSVNDISIWPLSEEGGRFFNVNAFGEIVALAEGRYGEDANVSADVKTRVKTRHVSSIDQVPEGAIIGLMVENIPERASEEIPGRTTLDPAGMGSYDLGAYLIEAKHWENSQTHAHELGHVLGLGHIENFWIGNQDNAMGYYTESMSFDDAQVREFIYDMFGTWHQLLREPYRTRSYEKSSRERAEKMCERSQCE